MHGVLLQLVLAEYARGHNGLGDLWMFGIHEQQVRSAARQILTLNQHNRRTIVYHRLRNLGEVFWLDVLISDLEHVVAIEERHDVSHLGEVPLLVAEAHPELLIPTPTRFVT
ncbi:hypothetical protein D3C71_1475790 [compost metagenome]